MPEAHPTLAGFRLLGSTKYMRVFEHPQLRVILAERVQGTPLPPQEVEQAHRALIEFGSGTRSWGLVVDTRAISGNNDPRFEAAIKGVNGMLLEHFARLVVLVQSVIGKLHARRLSKPSETIMVTTKIDAALEFLSE